MKRRATLRDVAEAVGVHVSTVSRALDPRTRHLITPEVAAQIIEASERLAYRPNAAAYSLKTNRTRTIGLVVPDIANPVFPPIIRGAEDALAEQGYVAILANTDGNPKREAGISETMRARGVDGLILASVTRDDETVAALCEEGLPIVTVNRQVDDPRVSSVVHDEDAGIRITLEHLVALGHRRIANVAGPQSLSTGRSRYAAFERHRAAMGLDAGEELVGFADAFREAEGERVTAEFLDSGVKFSALVCSNDRLAIGAISTLRKAGLHVPQDVSVTGYNDMPLADRLFPSLTTVRIAQYRAGFEAASILLAAMEEEPAQRVPRHVVLPVELVVRNSTGAIAGSRG